VTLPRFLDCAYVLLLEEYQRAGQDLLTAVSSLSKWAPGQQEPEQFNEEAVAARNTASMQMFQKMMRGTGV